MSETSRAREQALACSLAKIFFKKIQKFKNLTMYWSAARSRSCASAGSTSTLPVYTQRIIASKTGYEMFGIGISEASFSR